MHHASLNSLKMNTVLYYPTMTKDKFAPKQIIFSKTIHHTFIALLLMPHFMAEIPGKQSYK